MVQVKWMRSCRRSNEGRSPAVLCVSCNLPRATHILSASKHLRCDHDLWQCVAVFDWLIIAVWLQLLLWPIAVCGCVWLADHCSVTETVVVTYGNVWLCLIDWSLQCDWNCCHDLWHCVAVFDWLIIVVWLKLLSWLVAMCSCVWLTDHCSVTAWLQLLSWPMALCGCVWLADHCSVTETVVMTYGIVWLCLIDWSL